MSGDRVRGNPPWTRTPTSMDAVTLPQTALVGAPWDRARGALGPPRTAGPSPATEDPASDARGISALRLLGSVFIW